jgi:LEA14-like dessication related protein
MAATCDLAHGPALAGSQILDCGGPGMGSWEHPRRYIPLRATSRNFQIRAAVRLPALLLAIAGCRGLGDNFRDPDIQLDHAVVRGIGLTGGNLDLVVRVDNPNNFTIQGTRLQVGIDVQHSHLGDITYDSDFVVTENGTTSLTLPLRFGWGGVGSAVRAALKYGELPYEMKGQATLKMPWGLSTVVSFTHEGRAPLRQLGTTAGVVGIGPS